MYYSFLLGHTTYLLSLVFANTDQRRLGNTAKIYKSPCDLLSAKFPGQVAVPNSVKYEAGQASYWTAQQSQLRPACRFFPNDALDIKIAMADVLIAYNVSFAVTSGGYSTNSGASNIKDGVTIDLSSLAEVTLTDGNKAVVIGPGARWGDVYATLEPFHLSVPGARSASVGVGGFVLGGGLSWFADRYGWACNGALEFEIITPNAEIVLVNESSHADLSRALRGSLGAFGIVTRIKMPTVHSKYVYAGSLGYHWRYVPRVLHALQNLNERSVTDPSTQGFLSITWLGAEQNAVYNAVLMNTDGITWNDVFAAFKVIHHQTRTLRITTIGDSASEVDVSNPRGQRRTKFTLTCHSTYGIMMELHELVKGHKQTLEFDRDSVLSLTFEPLTVPHLRHQDGRHNIFKLDATSGPLLLVSVEFWWGLDALDTYFEAEARGLRSALQEKMRELGVLHGWVYPNYAHREQDPFEVGESLAQDTRQMMMNTRREYDPEGHWRKLVPGVWHI